MSGVGRCHMQCQKHAETARLSENDTKKHRKMSKNTKNTIFFQDASNFFKNCMKWLGYMYIKRFWVELASSRNFKSNRVSGKCVRVLTEAATTRVGYEGRQRLIVQKLKSRKLVKSFNSKMQDAMFD